MTLEEVSVVLKQLLKTKKVTKEQYDIFLQTLDQVLHSKTVYSSLRVAGKRVGTYFARKVRVHADERFSEAYNNSQEEKLPTESKEPDSKDISNVTERHSGWNCFLGKAISGRTTHTEKNGTSQKAKLFALLKDKNWHSTPEIQQKVYGGTHLGISRISARIYDIQKDGYEIESRRKTGTIWEYKIK